MNHFDHGSVQFAEKIQKSTLGSIPCLPRWFPSRGLIPEILPEDDPLMLAWKFVLERHHISALTLVHYYPDFYTYRDGDWRRVKSLEIRLDLCSYCEREVTAVHTERVTRFLHGGCYAKVPRKRNVGTRFVGEVALWVKHVLWQLQDIELMSLEWQEILQVHAANPEDLSIPLIGCDWLEDRGSLQSRALASSLRYVIKKRQAAREACACA